MREFSPQFAAHIASGMTTLATCWRLTRTDGVVLGFTDHDAPIAFDGTVFEPADGLDGSAAASRLGAQVDTADVVGVLTSEAIGEDDILMGRFDGAGVETWRADWRDPAVRALIGRATIGEITREDGRFRAELRSAQQALNVPSGRVYGRLCDAELGDVRCGVALDAASYSTPATVIAVHDSERVTLAGLGGFADGWFGFGKAEWTSGRRKGLTDRIVSHQRIGGADIVGFARPAGDWVSVGDALLARAGCDRRFETCRRKFANAVNFRGFPHVPGNDFVLRYPRPGDPLNGEPLVK